MRGIHPRFLSKGKPAVVPVATLGLRWADSEPEEHPARWGRPAGPSCFMAPLFLPLPLSEQPCNDALMRLSLQLSLSHTWEARRQARIEVVKPPGNTREKKRLSTGEMWGWKWTRADPGEQGRDPGMSTERELEKLRKSFLGSQRFSKVCPPRNGGHTFMKTFIHPQGPKLTLTQLQFVPYLLSFFF